MTQSRIRAILAVVALTAVMWILEIFDLLAGNALDVYGIRPRTIDDLGHIFTAPFLHYGFDHLVANTVPLLVLGSLVAFSGLGRFAAASLIIVVVSGLGVWLISPPNSVTLGASGLIFGYFGFLVLRGIIERRTIDIVIMICVVIFYGTMVFGVFPQQAGVSWQAHLFGFLGGLFAAYALPRRNRRTPVSGGYDYGPQGHQRF
ncbi:rhomboid family intramembrane serine protease [Marinitenerispora sediminis]|uniref:Rhomboid family intramembrane serine protease n=1 Tax=Marinitenerispora sediminis TaxID=1931232 RepID=A0A368T3T6_9ACTN|nr:rhomboid family intramembrane serine protease [Marinitenerispora sediminis]RCV49696.1 rhomboid family intramembrane serine protease [Marinitenerispora sediminis]RCV53334.1 rhomboid family intramembrane serine protease [Marinitenerispora sediminis]RCV57548.1 rhomboid family intramembrane serine protease [Marinitenerispora sediminis]